MLNITRSILSNIVSSVVQSDSGSPLHYFYSTTTNLTAASPQSVSLENVSYFDGQNGFMVMRYLAPATFVNYNYLMVAHDGSSSNTIGMRTDSGENLRGFVKDGGSNIHSSPNSDEKVPETTQVDILVFSPTSASVISGGSINTQSFATLPEGITTLNFSSRNGGADAKDLTVYKSFMAKGVYSLSQINNFAYRDSDILAAGGGQSLMRGHFVSQASSSDGGSQEFKITCGAMLGANTCVFVDGATGGSSISNTTGDANYWYDVAGDARGNAFDTFVNNMAATGFRPNVILWAQGEADSDNIGNQITRANYKIYLKWVFDEFRSLYGDVQIFIQKIGRRTAGYSNTGGIQAVREVQAELVAEYDWIHFGAESYDQELYTGDSQNVHLTDAGYVNVAERLANSVLSQRGYSVSGSVQGMRAVGYTRSGTSVTVTVEHDAGTDFTPTTGIEGFAFFDDGVEITNTAVRTNATTITLTLNSTPTGVETLYYGYDDMVSLNIANVVKDNSATALPMQAGIIPAL